MNERIQELADLAESHADAIVDQGGEFHPAYTQKLAELMIQECAKVIDSADSEGRLDDFAMVYLGEHFGVEE